MADLLTLVALPLVLAAILVSLVLGLRAMNRPGEEARSQSTRLMGWRVALHILAIVLVILIAVLR